MGIVPVGSLWVDGIQGGRGHSRILSRWLATCVTLLCETRLLKTGLRAWASSCLRGKKLGSASSCATGHFSFTHCWVAKAEPSIMGAAMPSWTQAGCKLDPAARTQLEQLRLNAVTTLYLCMSLCPWVAHRKIGAKLASAVCLENREARAEGGLACAHYIGDSCKDTSCIAGQWGSYPSSIHVK